MIALGIRSLCKTFDVRPATRLGQRIRQSIRHTPVNNFCEPPLQVKSMCAAACGKVFIVLNAHRGYKPTSWLHQHSVVIWLAWWWLRLARRGRRPPRPRGGSRLVEGIPHNAVEIPTETSEPTFQGATGACVVVGQKCRSIEQASALGVLRH